MDFGLDTIIVALIGALATIYGIREARAGRKDALVQQAAANRLADEKQELETLRAIIDAERSETDRARKDRADARAEAEAERTRRLAIETDLRAEVDLERARRIETETALRLSELQAARAGKRHAEEYAALLVLVRGEVMLEAGRTEAQIEQAEREHQGR